MMISRTHNQSDATGIVVAAAGLLTLGLVMVASADASLDRSVVVARFWETAFGRQAVFVAFGLLVILAVSRVGHRWLRWREGRLFQPSLIFGLVALACLIAVLVPGVGSKINGARRWLHVGTPPLSLSLQPSELAKLALVVLLAAMLTGRAHVMRSFWRGVLPAAGAIGVFCALVGKEDFGTAAMLAAVGLTMLLVGGARWRHLLVLCVVGAGGMVALLRAEPYRMERLIAFRDIWSDPQGAGYHPIQSLVSIASGGFTGRGLGSGIQKYGYLPESRSDFIFSVICEELGVLGAAIVIALFLALLWLGFRAVMRSVSPFERLLAFGVTFTLVFQAVMNIAVVTVCAPTKGISLPLVSAGGSGVLLTGAAVGLLVSVARAGESGPRDEPAAATDSYSQPREPQREAVPDPAMGASG